MPDISFPMSAGRTEYPVEGEADYSTAGLRDYSVAGRTDYPMAGRVRYVTHRWGGWPLGIAMLLGALLWLSAWAVASPTGSSPDEDFHLASIWCPNLLAAPCQTNEYGETLVPMATGQPCFAFAPWTSAACVGLQQDGLTWVYRVNAGEQPGGFYLFLHPLARGMDRQSVFRAVVTMRLLNAFIAVGLIGGLAYLLPRSGRRLLAYSAAITAGPMTAFYLASVNPSGWAVSGLFAAWFGAYAAFRAPTLARQILSAILAFLGGLMAATARADSAAFLAALGLAVAVIHWQHLRRSSWLWAIPTALFLAGSISFLTSGHLEVATVGFGAGDRQQSWLLFSNVMRIGALVLNVQQQSLNWIVTPMPPISLIPITLGWVMLAWWGWTASKPTWQKLIVAIGLGILLVVLPMYILQISGLLVGQGGIQERYFLPLLPILIAVSLWRPNRDGAPRLGRITTWILYVALVVGQAAALHTQIRQFTVGLGGEFWYANPNLNANVEWWHSGPSPMATWLLGSLGFAGLATALFWVRQHRPRADGARADDAMVYDAWADGARTNGARADAARVDDIGTCGARASVNRSGDFSSSDTGLPTTGSVPTDSVRK